MIVTADAPEALDEPKTARRSTVWRLLPGCALLLCLASVVLGVYFRLHELGSRVTFDDETITWLFVSGFSEPQFNARVFDGRVHTAGELAGFQQTHRDRGVALTLAALAISEPQHTPLYYGAERLWTGWWGDSLFAKRSLSAVAGVLLIPAVALLCWEIYGSSWAALIGSALAAVSPIQIVYSQMAREYELWSFLITLTLAALISAVRRPSVMRWITYGVLLTLTLYTHFFSVVLVAAAAIWVWSKSRRRDVVAGFTAATACALLAYGPWMLNVALRSKTAFLENAWSGTAWPLRYLVSKWAFNLSATFFDLIYVDMRYAIIGAAILGLSLYAFVELRRLAKDGAAVLVILVTLLSAAVLLVPDLLFHEHRSTMVRYVLPTFIGVQVAVAGLLAARLSQPVAARFKLPWLAIFAALLIAGVASASVRSMRPSWWEDNRDAPLPAIAAHLDSAQSPLVLAENGSVFLTLVNAIRSNVRVRIIDSRTNSWVNSARSGNFILAPSARMTDELERSGVRLELVVPPGSDSAPLKTFRSNLADKGAGSNGEEGIAAPALWRVIGVRAARAKSRPAESARSISCSNAGVSKASTYEWSGSVPANIRTGSQPSLRTVREG